MKKIFTLIALAALLVSCNDDAFLREDPKYLYTPDNAFSTQDQVDQTLLTCYSSIRDIRSMRSEGREYFVFRMCNGTDMYDVTTVRHTYQFNDYANINPEHSVFKFIFNYWYKMISYANMALYASELPQITWDSAESKAYAQAQAHFFRAYAYMNLAECFGGVFIVEELCTEPRFNFERSTRVETYQYAIDELKDRLEDFPETSPVKGRLVRGAAQHILSQLYLDMGIALEEEGRGQEAKSSYEKSVEYASDVIDGGLYSLMRNRFGTRMTEGPKY
ncbi:MAG: RagB/SusD family nutrient uptake outer membrane protein, partial [Bacteroidales bacterium]|nr:RagB/SusD family nutrient uptake outer membrane protein [Bacteroidales bacterium]